MAETDESDFHVTISLPLTPAQKSSISVAIQSAVTAEIGKLDLRAKIEPISSSDDGIKPMSMPSAWRPPWLGLIVS